MSDDKQLSFEGMVEDAAGSENEMPNPEEVHAGESSALAEATPAKMSIYTSDVTMDRDDIFIPRLRLVQGLSKEVQDGTAKPGTWVLSGYEPRDEVTIVPLLFARRRELVQGDDFNVLCSSDDAKIGEGNPGGLCVECPMNKWTDGPKGKRIPPKCTFIYSYVVYVVEHEAPGILEFKRTGITAGKALNTAAAQRGLGKFAVVLKSTAAQGPKGTYYAPSVLPAKVAPDILENARMFA